MRDRLLLHSGIHRYSLEIFGLDRAAPMCHRKALLQQPGNLLLTQPLAPARQRRAIKRSSCRNTTSPQKDWKYGFSTHRPHSASSERLCMCLRMNSPATSRVGNGGCLGSPRHTELKRPARKSQSISPASRQRMTKIDDLLQRRATGRLTDRAAGSSVSPRKRILPSKESRTAQIENPETQENRHAPRLSCKIDYLLRSNHGDRSIASEFFTDD
jgi:hypothetical protein